MMIANNPKVTIVIGRVNNTNKGFTTVLRIPKTTATIIAVTKFSTVTPGSKYAAKNTTKAFKRSFKISDIFLV